VSAPAASRERLDANGRNALMAAFFGWTLDAFDFFVLTFVLAPIATEFHVSIAQVALAITASLATRPIGAFLFGLLADRYGRRLPLMLDILFYSVIEVLSGFAPSFRIFFILRLLYGIGMGGEWGVGASLAMESVPVRWRGILSGFLQEGYALGYLLAAGSYWAAFPHWGWRPLFFIGGLPALLTLFIRFRVKESEVWKASATHRQDWRAYARAVISNARRFGYLVAMMAALSFISHGTMDIYPTFLQLQHHFSPSRTALVTIISMVGSILGGILAGWASDRFGRRWAMIVPIVLGLILIPPWAYATALPLILVGAFLMQFMVGGAWGVVPAHINELSPNEVRGFFSGFAYQLGILIASASPYIEARMAQHMSYAQAISIFAAIVLVLGAFVIGLGPEAHRVSFSGLGSTNSRAEEFGVSMRRNT
jgi:MFS transporter, SHS family, lactate transporter